LSVGELQALRPDVAPDQGQPCAPDKEFE
jgi:hypothetical protein